jgi:peptide/nickel transport system permease protein
MVKDSIAYRAGRLQNWALLAGSLLALLVVLAAVLGPIVAPKDPMENTYIGQSGTRFIRPPYPPGKVEGFPMGSDEFGRDVLSKLLWAVQPTMNLVLVVAGVRLLVGLLVGLVSGWSTGQFSRVMDGITSSALAVPVLFIALCVVAAIANRWGVWAFILGLSITGWADTARLAHDQTRAIKSQPFVEASEAMGAAGGQVVLSHVVPHILPLLWVQLAFEISATLLAVAALGFLGYFVNAVWVPGDADFVGIRASGAPELGQMLGVAVRNQPWTAMYAGSCVFLIVLTFNLLGEGLRASVNNRRQAKNTMLAERAGSWVEERVYLALAEWRRLATTGGALALLALAVLGGGWVLWQSQNAGSAVSQIEVPGGHLWAGSRHDSQSTYWSPLVGPQTPDRVWQIDQPGGFMGGPVVDDAGSLYLTGKDNQLFSYDSNGNLRWQVSLAAKPVGGPALAADGSVLVSDVEGNLQAFTPDGRARWLYSSDPPDVSISSPIPGPGGLVYYALKNFLVAVTAEGERNWQIRLPTYSYTSPQPRLSADGKYLFFQDFVIDAESGFTLFRESPEPMDEYMVGADGKIYFRSADTVVQWQPSEKGAVLIPQAKMDQNVIAAGYRFPYAAGVSPAGNIWLLYFSGWEYMRLVWMDPKGQSPQIIDFPYREGLLAGIDANSNAYVCGFTKGQLECRAVQLKTGRIVWKQVMEVKEIPVGGALVDGRLYLSTGIGNLLAVGK